MPLFRHTELGYTNTRHTHTVCHTHTYTLYEASAFLSSSFQRGGNFCRFIFSTLYFPFLAIRKFFLFPCHFFFFVLSVRYVSQVFNVCLSVVVGVFFVVVIVVVVIVPVVLCQMSVWSGKLTSYFGRQVIWAKIFWLNYRKQEGKREREYHLPLFCASVT